MKKSTIINSLGLTMFLFINSSCDIFSVQNTDTVTMIGMYKLTETISYDGQVISSDGTTAAFVYREWYGWTKTQPQQPIDSLFLLANIDGEIIEKFAIKEEISYNKRTQRREYILSSGKYFFIEYDQKANFFISEFVDSETDLKKDLKKGKYVYFAEKPNNW